jgi:HlyD family secretion protein
VARFRPSISFLSARTARPADQDGAGDQDGASAEGGTVPRSARIARRATAAVAVGSIFAVMLVACGGNEPSAPQTARVTRASVSSGVTSTGSLSAITEQNLGFRQGGQLTSVAVRVGDRVTAGQVLATIDDFQLRQTLAQQQAQLNSQQAVLNRLVGDPSVSGAQDSLGVSRDILDATQDQVDAQKRADKKAVDQAEKQLSVDKKALDQAEDQLSLVKSACKSSSGSSSSSSSSSSAQLNKSIEKALKALQDGDTEAASKLLPGLTGLLAGSGSSGSSSCQQQQASAQSSVTQAEQRVQTDRTNLEAAKQQVKVDEAAGQVSIENSRSGVVTAQNNLDSSRNDRPFNIAQQRALVVNGEALVRAAQRDVDDATLRAPVDATVSAINGTVGEFLSPSAGTTALAPGSDASIPGIEEGQSQAAGNVATVPRPGGSQFIVLGDVNRLQVVLPFEESDAAQIQPNQKVSVGFDAFPELDSDGTVLSVAPSGTAISGVISYYVTVVLNQGDPRLKDGQTARATVITQQLDNVLSVPNAAVRREGNASTVVVVGPNGEQRPVTFQPGVVGADRTQVISGLFDGQEVVVPSAR